MTLAAGQGRREDADQAKLALERPQDVGVVLVERVERAGCDRVHLTGRDILDLADTGDAVVALEWFLYCRVSSQPSSITVSCRE